ncbi:exodeoxyribonuclease VII large subunit [filamentous cyanobacterium CCP5]|nr:exodeoxyribonuclease VII large subunit [filamentous cyanobacterium CCP5]
MDAYLDSPQTIAAISVAGLTDYLRVSLEEDPTLRQIWVIGEVSNARRHPSGFFFTLKDPEGSECVNCVVWRSQLPRLSSLPEAGDQVVVLGTVRVYPQRSSYQLMVWQVLPSGDGLRALRLQRLKERLQAEGLFDPDQKRSLPAYPQVLGVVTSAQAAAWGDIQRTLAHHHPGLQVILSPATVQGDLAPRSIERAIARLVADGRTEVLILARGGGATEDLDCFNDERVVRAIATCPMPIVTGIGHQRDESLADLAADVCAHTPTAAATVAVPALTDLDQAHRDRAALLVYHLSRQLTAAETCLADLGRRLQNLRCDRQLAQQSDRLQQLQQRLIRDIQIQFQQQTQRCTALKEQLTTLDPEAVLRRGYALVRDAQNQLVTDASQVEVGDSVEIQLASGRLRAEVRERES